MALQLRKLGAPINDLQVAPVQQQPLIPGVQVAAPQPLNLGSQVIQPNPQARTGMMLPPPPPSFADQVGSFAKQQFLNPFVDTAKSLGSDIAHGELGAPVRFAAAKLTDNSQAAKNALQDIKHPAGYGTGKPLPRFITVNGKKQINPEYTQQFTNLAMGMAEAKPIIGKGANEVPKPKVTKVTDQSNVFGKDGKAWQDYNKRYSGVDMNTAKSRAEFDAVSNGDPKMFNKTPDAIRLKDTIAGTKRVGYVDNHGYDSLFAKKAKEAGLYTKKWNGVTLAGKNKADVESYAASNNHAGQTEHFYIGNNHDSYLAKPKVTLKTTTGKQLTEKDFNKIVPAVKGTPTLTPDELATLTPKEQMALHTHDVPLNKPEVNTARNPYKAAIPEVKQGEYGQVVANEQAASLPVQFAGDRWKASMRKLSPDEQTNFWRAVEQPHNPNYSPQLQQAIAAWRDVDNRIHGTSQSLGGNTNYLNDHNLHPWNLPSELTDHIVNGGDPNKFSGLNNISRKYRTIAEGEANGLKLGTDPINEGNNYINASAALLKRRAIVKGLGEADGHMEKKTHAFDIGGGNSIPISNEARKAVRGLVRSPASDSRIIKGARTANAGLKSSILSLGQFHPINISVLRAAPTLALRGHPIRAVKGVGKTFRPLLPGGDGFVERTKAKALADGMVDKAAKIGMPYGAGGFDTEGSFLKGGVGHKMVFDKQMFGMHDETVRSVVSDLERKGISLDSPEARAAGKAGNNLMGFVNSEAQKIPPKVNRALGDWLLAKQFTHSKFSQARTAVTKGGVAGSYARANVAANVLATTALIAGLGYLGKQNSDNVRDLFLRALVDPGAPTASKDSKGDNVKLRTPGTDTSDIAKLLGIKLVRQRDGHLGLSWKPTNMPSTVEDYARARLSPFLSSAVKVGTNTTYAGKPLYDPNAPAGTKAEQAATSLGIGLLPIGAQGLPYTNAVKSKLPQNVQDVLNAQQPGTNPLLKSIGSSFGVTPTTDTTVGKGLQSSQYFSALDAAKSDLNSHEKDVLDLYTGSKKNPVTGAYDVQPNVNDTVAKARALLDQPKVIDKLIAMNAQLAKQGQKVDPLWTASKDEITKVLQYQSMPPGGADRTHWETLNGSWYNPLATLRSDFFGSLPRGDPNKPQAPIAYPTASTDVAAAQKQFFGLTDAKARAEFLQAHPEVQQQLDAQVAYNNELRQAQGYSALDSYPTASPDVQKIINTYNSLPQHDGSKGGNKTRSLWITAHPEEYKQMSDYYTQASIYSLQKEAGQSQFTDTEPSQKLLKDAYSLGQYDIVKNADGTYSLGSSYSSSGSGGSGKSSGYSSYSSSGRKYVSRTAAEMQNPFYNALDIGAGGKKNIGKAQKPKTSKTVSLKPKKSGFQPKVSNNVSPTKLKVGLKHSKV